MFLQLSIVRVFAEGKFLNVLHVGSDLVEHRLVFIFNEGFLLLHTLVMKLRADVFAKC
jgi:hypothetical protein